MVFDVLCKIKTSVFYFSFSGACSSGQALSQVHLNFLFIRKASVKRIRPSGITLGGLFLCLNFAKCHQNGTKENERTAKPSTVERFLLVEMRRIELLCVCSPVNRMSVFSGLLRVNHSLCPSDMDLLSPKTAPKVRSIMSAA